MPTHRDADSDSGMAHRHVLVGITAIMLGCGTTVIGAEPGHEWCVEVQGPTGSTQDPTELDQNIREPDSKDPRGCHCFSTAEDLLLQTGTEAQATGQQLPPGYEDLRDQLESAARLRCTELALAAQPPLMHTDCLSADVGLPYPNGPTNECSICVEASVWGDDKEEVECPPELGGTGGASTTTDPTGESQGTVDDSGDGDAATVDCSQWTPQDALTSKYYTSGRPEGWYHAMDQELLDQLVSTDFAPMIACDQGRYLPRGEGWVFDRIAPGDLLWVLGLRNGYTNAKLRAYDPTTFEGTTSWIPLDSIEGAVAARDALIEHSTVTLATIDATHEPKVERLVFIEVTP